MTDTDATNRATERTGLRRLETLLDVAYAVLFVQFMMYLPRTEDMTWTDLPYGLLSLLWGHSSYLIRLVVAVGLTLIQWNLTHKLLGPLERTNALHTLLVLLQMIFVCLFLFFAIADPTLVSVSSPVGQSICLAISGFLGVAGWWYARRQGLVRSELTVVQKNDVGKRVIIEPVTAFLNTGLGFVGPNAWTLGWFVIPLVLMGVRRWHERVR